MPSTSPSRAIALLLLSLTGPALAEAVDPPGGLYLGYYQEDALNNPEDPMPGTLLLNLPAGNAKFQGNMSFSYIGCQSHNVGTVGGDKLGTALTGQWTGTVDNRPQRGNYLGNYNARQQLYSGTYNNAGGKQKVVVPNCIQYFIAAKGTWELFPAERTVSRQSNAKGVSYSSRQITWDARPGTAASLVSAIDRAQALANGPNAVLWQTLVMGPGSSAKLPTSVKLIPGQTYLFAVASRSNKGQRSYYSSAAITAP
jgi:hypothetical protein